MKKQVSAGTSTPAAERPHMPGYGVPESKKGLLDWSHVTERMTAAQNYWICTVSPDAHPHATPVWGLWLENKLYFGGGPMTKRSRNLRNNSAANVHLESGSEVITMEGEAHPMTKPDLELIARLIELSGEKYGYRPKPEEYEAPGGFVFTPKVVLAWKEFPKDATRWRLG